MKGEKFLDDYEGIMMDCHKKLERKKDSLAHSFRDLVLFNGILVYFLVSIPYIIFTNLMCVIQVLKLLSIR